MDKDGKTRREFLSGVLKSGTFAAAGGLVGIGISRDACGADGESRTEAATARIDPDLILYKETGKPISTGFAEARALIVDESGKLYAAGDKAIKVIEPDGGIRSTHTLEQAPRCLAIADKELYIGTRDHVIATDIDCRMLESWPGLGENAVITGIAVDEGHVYVADAGQRIVWCFDRKGRLVRRIGDKDPERNIPGFVVPSPYFDLAVAPDGLLRVANPGRHRIEAYTVKGDLEVAWGGYGNSLADFAACCNPMSFDVMADGSFVTCEKGIIRIKVYDAGGVLKGVVAGPDQLTGGIWAAGKALEQAKRSRFDVAVDKAGRIYVLDRIKAVVRTFILKEA